MINQIREKLVPELQNPSGDSNRIALRKIQEQRGPIHEEYLESSPLQFMPSLEDLLDEPQLPSYLCALR